MNEPRTCVTFKSSAFNTTEAKDYFINLCCFGDDVAKWLIEELKNRKIEVDNEPGQEDFGWYLTFFYNGTRYNFVLGWRPEDDENEGDWIGTIERAGVLAAVLGRKRRVEREVVSLIHDILVSSPKARDIRWHFDKDFMTGNENGVAEPFTT